MGLFQGKQKTIKKSSDAEAADVVDAIFDEQYREELRTIGRKQFKTTIDDSAASFKKDFDSTIATVSADLKNHLTKQLDTAIATMNTTLSKHLNERLAEYDKVTKDAQDQAVQSLNRNAVALHEKYQHLSSTLQQTVASQEVMMISVFDENKARMAKSEVVQEAVLRTLSDTAKTTQEQAKQLGVKLEKSVTDQEVIMKNLFDENMARVADTKNAQDVALKALNDSAQALLEQHQQLSASIQQTVVDQKEIMTSMFEENMARIIEHYLLGALGDQYDMKAQLPSIIKQMEQNKQAIMDDMKL